MASGIPKVVTRYALLNATMPCKGKIIGGICSVWRTHQKPDERSGNRRNCKVDEGAHIQDDQTNNVGPKKSNAFFIALALGLHCACSAAAAAPPVGAAAEKPNADGVSFFVCFICFGPRVQLSPKVQTKFLLRCLDSLGPLSFKLFSKFKTTQGLKKKKNFKRGGLITVIKVLES
jgi:hypothetical protein